VASTIKDIVNPIDKDKITETPGLLPYAHQIGSAVVKPEDIGRIKGRSMAAMYEQSQMQLDQIKEQIHLLALQAEKIKDRIELSNQIYEAKYGFEPLIGHVYYLYETSLGQRVLSMVAPSEWGRKNPYVYIATVKLLADHTWEITHQNDDLTL